MMAASSEISEVESSKWATPSSDLSIMAEVYVERVVWREGLWRDEEGQ